MRAMSTWVTRSYDEWQSLPSKEKVMTINISLPVEMEARVREHVASGLYGSASEVVREALRLFEAYQSVRSSTLVALKADLENGMVDLQAGRVAPLNMAAIKAEGRARRSKNAP
jgi:antitoxin ParD1/3/4